MIKHCNQLNVKLFKVVRAHNTGNGQGDIEILLALLALIAANHFKDQG